MNTRILPAPLKRSAATMLAGLFLSACMMKGAGPDAFDPAPSTAPAAVVYRYASVDGHEVFYREAGSRRHPTIVLLHGFPSSSHMFRDLIPLLADRFHVVAPDYIGFG